MITLALDAATYVGTAAVFDGDRLLASGETAMRGKDSERLLPLVLETLEQAGLELARVGRVVCGAGPGSFTSLRIAASIAKGIAAGRAIPLMPVSSLALIIAGNVGPEAEGRYLAALDAMRGESFVQQLDVRGPHVRTVDEPHLAPSESLEALGRSRHASLAGPSLPGSWMPHARGAMRLAPSVAADLGSWEPDYGRKAEAQSRWESAQGRSLEV
jgi:tRNA threonylcarbamoyladenosine biosynthesis protein TsaB